MLDRLWKSGLPGPSFRADLRKTSERPSCRPLVESLENRRLLAASLAPISNVSVPAQLGYQLALDGSGSNAASQTFTPPTSSNPDIKVSVAQGPFWTLTVSHAPANSSDVTITNESMTFQLFQDLTPNTVSRIETLSGGPGSSGNFYTTTAFGGPGQFIPRITQSSNAIGSIIQGGSTLKDSTSSSSTLAPISTEPVQQLAFTGSDQLAMAKSSAGTDAQFFITNGTSPASAQQTLDFNFTLFGQLVTGQQTVTDLSKVAVQAVTGDGSLNGELSQPITPVVINSATLSAQNPNGVLHIDTTSAKAGETATITVTAKDPTTNTTSRQTFTVTVVAYNGPTNPVINFVPFANAVNTSTPTNTETTVQLNGQSGFPSTSSSVSLTYQLTSQPTHGTISQFNSSTGTLVYTPNSGYIGLDSFQYTVTSTGPNSSPASLTSRAGTVEIGVGQGVTGAVRLITNSLGNVLVVDPLPRTNHGTNVINVTEQSVAGTPTLQVIVNGVLDPTQPAASSVSRLVIFGAKASDQITVDPSVTVPTTLDGGHGGKNVVKAGGGLTLEHGWFGQTTLVGGTGTNQLIGRKGFVRFQPSSTTNLIFAGVIRPRNSRHRTQPPKGTFYRFQNGRLVPVASLP